MEGCTSHNGRRYAMSALQSERPQPARAAACIPPVHRHACTARWFAVRDAPGERRRGPAFRIPRLSSVFSIVARSSSSCRRVGETFFFARGAPGVAVKFRRRNEGRGQPGGSAGNLVPARMRRPAIRQWLMIGYLLSAGWTGFSLGNTHMDNRRFFFPIIGIFRLRFFQ